MGKSERGEPTLTGDKELDRYLLAETAHKVFEEDKRPRGGCCLTTLAFWCVCIAGTAAGGAALLRCFLSYCFEA